MRRNGGCGNVAGWREKSKRKGGVCLVCLWQREGDGREVVFREDEVVAGSVASDWWRWVKEKTPIGSKLGSGGGGLEKR